MPSDPCQTLPNAWTRSHQEEVWAQRDSSLMQTPERTNQGSPGRRAHRSGPVPPLTCCAALGKSHSLCSYDSRVKCGGWRSRWLRDLLAQILSHMQGPFKEWLTFRCKGFRTWKFPLVWPASASLLSPRCSPEMKTSPFQRTQHVLSLSGSLSPLPLFLPMASRCKLC